MPSLSNLDPAVCVPAATPDSSYCVLYNRAPAFAELARAELSRLADGEFPESGVFLTRSPLHWGNTAYGVAGGRQLAFGIDVDTTCQELRAQAIVAPRMSIRVRRIPAAIRGAQSAKKAIVDCIDGAVDFAEPQLRLLLIRSKLGYRVLLEDEDGLDDRRQDWLQVAHKPNNVPVAMPVRIARAAINMTARPGDTVFDPFCGSGTIPLVASFAGFRALGSDISFKRLVDSRVNAAHFSKHLVHDFEPVRGDATKTKQTADCIVTNPPYGAYSHLVEGGMQTVLANLKNLAERVTLVTTEKLEPLLLEEGYDIREVVCTEPDRCLRYIYLTHTR